VLVALFAVALTRFTRLKEDASFTLTYLLSLTLGVVMVSLKGNGLDLLHMLFGDILAIDNNALLLVTLVSSITLAAIAIFYRELVIECFDPDFLRAGKRKTQTSAILFVLLVINLVAAFQALGTLMALGLMLLPAIAAGFWTRKIDRTVLLSIIFALAASYSGLLLSYYRNIPAGSAVVLVAGIIALGSTLLGKHGSFRSYLQNEG
jgi:zinc/manganese transport system permease protein